VTHLAIFPGWHAGLAATPGLLEPIQRWTVDTHTIIGEPETAVYRPHWPYQESVALETPSQAQLGGNVTLLGYDFAPPDDAASPLSLTLYWECRVPLGADYQVFVHVLDEEGQIVAQQDRPPYFGMAPTSLWQAGDVIRDPFRIDLSPDLPPGTYTVSAGLYDPESGSRLPVSGAAESEGNAIYLTTFTR
jgi:hypothetical protein